MINKVQSQPAAPQTASAADAKPAATTDAKPAPANQATNLFKDGFEAGTGPVLVDPSTILWKKQ